MPVSGSCSRRKRFSRSSSAAARHPGVDAAAAPAARRRRRSAAPAASWSASEPRRIEAAALARLPRRRCGRGRRCGRAAAGCGSRSGPAAPRRPAPSGAGLGGGGARRRSAPSADGEAGGERDAARRRARRAGRCPRRGGSRWRGRAAPSGSGGEPLERGDDGAGAGRLGGGGHGELGGCGPGAPARGRAPGAPPSTMPRPTPSASAVVRANRRSGAAPAGASVRWPWRADASRAGAAHSLRRGGDLARYSRRSFTRPLKSKSAGSSRWLGAGLGQRAEQDLPAAGAPRLPLVEHRA